MGDPGLQRPDLGLEFADAGQQVLVLDPPRRAHLLHVLLALGLLLLEDGDLDGLLLVLVDHQC
jgi:hypothetical protein